MSESLIERLGWNSYIGKELISQTGDEVQARDIRRYAMAIGDPNPAYYDEKRAKKGKYGKIVAPPVFVYWSTRNATYERNVEDLTESGIFPEDLLGVPELPNADLFDWVRGSDDFEFHRPLFAGDRVTLKCKIIDFTVKERVNKLVFVTLERIYSDQHGDLLARHWLTFIGIPKRKDIDL